MRYEHFTCDGCGQETPGSLDHYAKGTIVMKGHHGDTAEIDACVKCRQRVLAMFPGAIGRVVTVRHSPDEVSEYAVG